MSTTTQILFNSPALHSLKREQLVKLCKIHGIKANGKNVELIDRLKQRAQEIPPHKPAVTTIENDSEDTDQDMGDDMRMPLPRPSEQWEIVMEDIAEVEESSSMGTLSSMKSLQAHGSAGEFGTSSSKNSVTSSIKALASSLGLKRALSKSSSNPKIFPPASSTSDAELDMHAVPYSAIPPSRSLPATDHFKLSTPDITMVDGDASIDAPIPGGPSRPGAPAPANARLSTGEGLTTTIRLISSMHAEPIASPPRLQPFQTSFDLIMSPDVGKPGHKMSVWPASPGNQGPLYPSLDALRADASDRTLASPAPAFSAAKRFSMAMPSDQQDDIFSPRKPVNMAASSTASASTPRNEPFLFGSPLPGNRPRVSNADFEKTAASVLEEMNKRLAESGVQSVNANLLNAKATETSTDVFGSAANQSHQRTNSTDRFGKAHEDAFAKMDSIANHYAAKRGAPSNLGPRIKKRKSDILGLGPAPGSKRKSSAASTRVISNGVRKRMIPGGFGDDEGDQEDVDDAGDRRSSKRLRMTESQDVHKGKQASLLTTVAGEDEEAEEDRVKEERKREVMKRKLDESRARRSSRGRASIGKAAPAKPKASRFGFLNSAKSLVRNVWNMGAGSNAKTPSNIPVPKASAPSKAAPATVQASSSKILPKQLSIGLGKPSTSKNTDLSTTRTASAGTSSKASVLSTDTRKTSTSRSRSPIPPFNASSQNSKPPAERPRTGSTGTANSRMTTSTETGTASRIPSRVSSTTAVSSMGTRMSVASGSAGVSSMGTKRSLATNATGSIASRLRADSSESKIPPVPKRSSSTLMAPTVSSLAKRQGAIRSPSAIPRSPASSTLQQITNSPQSPRPTQGKIFSSPFTGFDSSPTSVPTPVQKPSFAAVGATLLGTPSTLTGPVPPKPDSFVGKKPRISRSRVIARLNTQRAATGSSSAIARPSAKTRPRSSIGAAARRSLGGVKAGGRNSAGLDTTGMKKRARQSEVAARRMSRATANSTASTMDVDD